MSSRAARRASRTRAAPSRGGLLDRDDAPREVREPHQVARDALGQRDDRVAGPVRERDRPGQRQQARIDAAGRDGQGIGHCAPRDGSGPHATRRGGQRTRRAASLWWCVDQAETTGLSLRRSPDSMSKTCTWPGLAARVTVSPACGCVATVDARHDVGALAGDVDVAVEVAVGAELLDQVDVDREALAVGGADARCPRGARPR